MIVFELITDVAGTQLFCFCFCEDSKENSERNSTSMYYLNNKNRSRYGTGRSWRIKTVSPMDFALVAQWLGKNPLISLILNAAEVDFFITSPGQHLVSVEQIRRACRAWQARPKSNEEKNRQAQNATHNSKSSSVIN